MLAVTNIDTFVLANGVMQRYPRKKQPIIYYGLSAYFGTSPQKEHALVIDAHNLFAGVQPEVQFLVSKTGEIQWELLDAYLDTNPKRLPIYTFRKPNIINDMIQKASDDDKHALSAMLSNFTPAIRPAVKTKVIEFLTDPKVKKFELPQEMRPKRGRAVEYYNAAAEADYSELKADILLDDVELRDKYEARYWKRVIAKELAKGDKTQK